MAREQRASAAAAPGAAGAPRAAEPRGAASDRRARRVGSAGARSWSRSPRRSWRSCSSTSAGSRSRCFMIADRAASACTSSTGCSRAGGRSPLVGFAALAAMVLAARYGNVRDVLEVAVAALPVLVPGRDGPRRRGGADGRDRRHAARRLLDRLRVRARRAAAPAARTATAILIDVLVGTFLGDTGAYFGGRLFGRRPLAPQISPEQDRRRACSAGCSIAILAVFFAACTRPG